MPKGPMLNDVNLNIRITTEMRDVINAQAKASGIKASALIRGVLVTYLEVRGKVDRSHLPSRGYDSIEVGHVVTKDGKDLGDFLD